MKSRKIKITDFRFSPAGFGHYKVSYESPITGKTWIKTISDMTIIDETKNSENPKLKDLNRLRRRVKDGGYIL
jgi:hypothetical protein